VRESVDKKFRVLELDVLRGLAATMVFLFHCSLILPPSERGMFSLGVTGVDLFFMISGFVILLTLRRTNHWKEFVGNRFVRLFPTYWACVSFTAILIFLGHLYLSTQFGNLLTDFLGNLTMFPRYMDIPFLDEQYWTLEVEMLFYIFMLVVYLLRGLKSIEIIGYIVIN
jgi:peptidoglycan/LPS O-acetylase OafA/YrhL